MILPDNRTWVDSHDQHNFVLSHQFPSSFDCAGLQLVPFCLGFPTLTRQCLLIVTEKILTLVLDLCAPRFTPPPPFAKIPTVYRCDPWSRHPTHIHPSRTSTNSARRRRPLRPCTPPSESSAEWVCSEHTGICRSVELHQSEGLFLKFTGAGVLCAWAYPEISRLAERTRRSTADPTCAFERFHSYTSSVTFV